MADKDTYTYYLPDSNSAPQPYETPVNSIIIIGANGSGKSKLGAWIENRDFEGVHRIAAQRNINFSERIPLKSYEEAESTVLYGSADISSKRNKGPRWAWGKSYTTTLLNDFNDVLAALIAQLNNENHRYVEDCKLAEKQGIEKPPTRESSLDKLLSIWNQVFPHRHLKMRDAHFTASIPESNSDYSGTQMSDGERSVLYLVSQVLCVPENKTLIIDEPEVHLHPSLMGRLWSALENTRPDCLFIFITHDTQLAALHKNSDKIWIKSYDGTKWDWSPIPESELPEQLLLELLGNRKNVLFVEGANNSYDIQLYSALYPNFYVVPCGGCDQVISNTKAFASTTALHSLTAYGIIDRDYRSDEELQALNAKGIFSLKVAEIENLFLVEPVLRIAAERFACSNVEESINSIKEYVIHQRFAGELDRQIGQAAISHLKTQLRGIEIDGADSLSISDIYTDAIATIDPKAELSALRARFEKVLRAADYESVLELFNAKGVSNSVGHHLGINDKEYRAKVIKLLKSDCAEKLLDALRPYVPRLPCA